MPDRSWEHGLHQLIEAKEGLQPTRGRDTIARMTYQRFFRRYHLLGGLSGTAVEAAREFWAVYGLRVRVLPPHRPNRKRRGPTQCLPDARRKWACVARLAQQASQRGQPVLIGTRSVRASEDVAAELQRAGVPHVVLNARQDAEEAAIVARAGQAGQITVATNMAGRGTDIKPDARALEAGGLLVLLTEFHESARVDRQLHGRAGRQGQSGRLLDVVAADDSIFGTAPAWLRAALRAPAPWLRRAAARMARRWVQWAHERRALRARVALLKQDRSLHRWLGFAGRPE